MISKLFNKRFAAVFTSALLCLPLNILTGCQSGSLRTHDRTQNHTDELSKVSIQSDFATKARNPQSEEKTAPEKTEVRIELRLASTEKTGNWIKTDLLQKSFFIDAFPFLASQDIESIVLRKQKWRDLSEASKQKLATIEPEIGQKSSTLYSIELHLSTLGAKIYEDVQQKYPDKLLLLKNTAQQVLLYGFVDSGDDGHRPVLYFAAASGATQADQQLQNVRHALELSPDL